MPCSISSQEKVNDFKPTPKDAEGAREVVDRLLELSGKFEKQYASLGVTAVTDYPTEWAVRYGQ